MLNAAGLDSVFKTLAPSNSGTANATSRVLALSLDPLVDKKGAFEHVTNAALAKTAIKTTFLTAMLVTTQSMTQALQDLQDAEEPNAGTIRIRSNVLIISNLFGANQK